MLSTAGRAGLDEDGQRIEQFRHVLHFATGAPLATSSAVTGFAAVEICCVTACIWPDSVLGRVTRPRAQQMGVVSFTSAPKFA